jgi:hypothetical protein
MELHVLYADSGNILAAVRLDEEDEESSGNAALGDEPIPAPRPVPEPGQYTADLKVPDDLTHLGFLEVCEQLVVEGRGAQAVLKSRESGQSPSPAD